MRKLKGIAFLCVVLLLQMHFGCSQQVPEIIFDTDIGPDYDDVGALTILHAFEDQGKCRILATIASNRHTRVAAVMDVINTYFKKPDIPIGVVRGPALELAAWQKWDSLIVARYPHDLRSNDNAIDATELYRKVLAASDDKSVTIVTVGFLTNMANLLKSQPDQYSKLNGEELVSQKVKRLVSMAGRFPDGKEFNVEKDAQASMWVAAHWPGEIIFTGWEIGARLFSGVPLMNSEHVNSPVKDVFATSIPKSNEDIKGRKSWDQTAVLIAVEGAEKYYDLVPGRIVCLEDGGNTWDGQKRGHYFVKEKVTAAEVERLINQLMLHTPRQK